MDPMVLEPLVWMVPTLVVPNSIRKGQGLLDGLAPFSLENPRASFQEN
jgi:hypothetical protein